MTGLYVVQRIVGKRIKDGKNVEYKVKWKNYDSSQNTWEPVKNLKNVESMIEEFQQRNKDKLSQFHELKIENNSGRPTIQVHKTFDTKSGSEKSHSQRNEEMRSTRRQSDRIVKKGNVFKNKVHHIEMQSESEESENEMQDENKGKGNFKVSRPGNMQKEGFQEDILGFSLNNIAQKIMVAVKEKNKPCQIVGIVKGGHSQVDLYQVIDSEGNREFKRKQQVFQNYSLELISYYEKRIDFKPKFE